MSKDDDFSLVIIHAIILLRIANRPEQHREVMNPERQPAESRLGQCKMLTANVGACWPQIRETQVQFLAQPKPFSVTFSYLQCLCFAFLTSCKTKGEVMNAALCFLVEGWGKYNNR